MRHDSRSRPCSYRLVSRSPLVAALALLAAACAHSPSGRGLAPPPALRASESRSDFGMVASGSSEATAAGVEILERGGNAIDAAVAAAFALGVAEPGGSGLGGMTDIVVRLADGRELAIDGTALIPLKVDLEALGRRLEGGHPRGYELAATPSSLAALERARARYGTMSLPEVLAPAIEVAERGFGLARGQVPWLETYLDDLLASDYLRLVVLEGGETVGEVGARSCRPDLATTLRRIAAAGPDAFYRGPIAAEIEADMVAHGGFVRRADLALVDVRELRPLVGSYRGARVVTAPPPASGAVVVAILNLLEALEPQLLRADTPERLRLLVDASRLVTGELADGEDDDRDPSLDLRYLDKRVAAAAAERLLAHPAGDGMTRPPLATGERDTTHLSVVDRWGNAVALTQTLGRQFGAKVATPGLGFPYNSLLETFDPKHRKALPLRPRGRYPTYLAPTIVVLPGGQTAVLGSAGSDRIPLTIAGVISNLVDRGLGIRDAVVAPRVLWSGEEPRRLYLEIAPPIDEATADALERLGFTDPYRLRFPPRPIDLSFFGAVNATMRDPRSGGFTGVGDPRRAGFAAGPRL